jgi:hypothetical protein
LDVTNIDKLPVTTHRIDKPLNDIIYVSEAPDILTTVV